MTYDKMAPGGSSICLGVAILGPTVFNLLWKGHGALPWWWPLPFAAGSLLIVLGLSILLLGWRSR